MVDRFIKASVSLPVTVYCYYTTYIYLPTTQLNLGIKVNVMLFNHTEQRSLGQYNKANFIIGYQTSHSIVIQRIFVRLKFRNKPIITLIGLNSRIDGCKKVD